MVEKSKLWHKLLLILLKYIPFIIAAGYLFGIIFSCINIKLFILPSLIYISPFSGVLILVMSKALKFCEWHRLPIYYCFVIDILSTIDYKYHIPLSNWRILIIYLLITLIFILFGMYLKEKHNAKVRVIKNQSSESNR